MREFTLHAAQFRVGYRLDHAFQIAVDVCPLKRSARGRESAFLAPCRTCSRQRCELNGHNALAAHAQPAQPVLGIGGNRTIGCRRHISRQELLRGYQIIAE
jgi:hypothetical protein